MRMFCGRWTRCSRFIIAGIGSRLVCLRPLRLCGPCAACSRALCAIVPAFFIYIYIRDLGQAVFIYFIPALWSHAVASFTADRPRHNRGQPHTWLAMSAGLWARSSEGAEPEGTLCVEQQSPGGQQSATAEPHVRPLRRRGAGHARAGPARHMAPPRSLS